MARVISQNELGALPSPSKLSTGHPWYNDHISYHVNSLTVTEHTLMMMPILLCNRSRYMLITEYSEYTVPGIFPEQSQNNETKYILHKQNNTHKNKSSRLKVP